LGAERRIKPIEKKVKEEKEEEEMRVGYIIPM
jgi:hypothetical protein